MTHLYLALPSSAGQGSGTSLLLQSPAALTAEKDAVCLSVPAAALKLPMPGPQRAFTLQVSRPPPPSLPPKPAHSFCPPAHPHPLGAVNPELSQTWGCFQVALYHLLGEGVAEQSSHPILTRRLASSLGPLTSPAPTPLLHGFTLHLLGAQLLQDLSQVFLLLEASSISTLGRGLSPWDRVALVCLLTSLLACPLPSAQRGVIIRAFQGLEWNLLTTGLFKTQIYSK